MFTTLRRNRWIAFLAAPVLALAMGLASGESAFAHGGHGGGGHGGFGGHFGGFHGGHFGGFGGHFGGFGGRIGGVRGYGGFNRGLYGYGLGGYGLGGYGLGGYGLAGYGLGGYGLGGYGWGYPYFGYGGYGYGYPYYGYGYGYPYYGYAYNPYYGYGYGYGYPYSGYVASYPTVGYSSPHVVTVPATGASPTASATQQPALGIEARQVFEVNGQEAVRVSTVYPGTAADKAGLKTGDTIESANGYMTQVPENLSWIIKNAAPGKILKMTVRTAKDGLDHTFTATLRR